MILPERKIPDFIIVGAPKCGTTALDNFLSQHPDIFMAKKELHYFGSDLESRFRDLTLGNYLRYFETEKTYKLYGESSVWYLYTKNAAQEIYEYNPWAKIIIMLRDPVKMLPSLHAQLLYNGDETVKSFHRALRKDMWRSQAGQKLPSVNYTNRPTFFDACRFYEPVKRFLDRFGKQQVLILLNEDLQNNFEETFHKVLAFLEADVNFISKKERINTRRKIRSISLHHFSKATPELYRRIFRITVPSQKLRHYLMKKVQDINVTDAKIKTLDPATRALIAKRTRPDIEKLAALINRDLSHWSRE